MLFKFKVNKKGQAAAATLLAIISAAMILFVILVSPEERESLLTDGTDSSVSTSSEVVDTEILLSESPGRVEYLSLNEVQHSLPSVRIYTRSDSVVLSQKNSIYTKNGLFSDAPSNVVAIVDDLEETDSLVLSFTVNDARGNLIVKFNGEELMNEEVTTGDTPILQIPDYLIENSNLLVFEMNSPGLVFWRSNFVSLTNMKLVGRVADLENQEASNTFIISDTEYYNLENLVLNFQPECNEQVVGRLHVSINDYNVYSGIPDCGLKMTPIEFSPALVYNGENKIIFKTEYEEYQLFHVNLISNLEEVDYTTYYFNLDYEQQQAIESENNAIKLNLEFIDDTTSKKGYVLVNGHKTHFDTKEISETIDIGSDIVQGNNALKLIPSKTIEIRELIVELK